MHGKREQAQRAIGVVMIALALGGLMAGVNPQLVAGAGEPHICRAENGVIIEQRGTATCFADSGSYATAIGPRARAVASNTSVAYAQGNGSLAEAENRSISKATGTQSSAQSVDRGAAYADGKRSVAVAIADSAATAIGARSHAHAANSSTATATGACYAEALGGATVSCTGRLMFTVPPSLATLPMRQELVVMRPAY
jgi:hypothetical protein